MINYATIQIDGKKVGLKFGLPSYRMLMEKVKIFPQLWNADGETMNEAGYAYILYFGYINNCMIKEQVPSLTFETFMEYIETMDENETAKDEVALAFEIWSQSREVQKLQANVEEVKKKNGSLTSSNPSVTGVSVST